jgi:hypothetical protein
MFKERIVNKILRVAEELLNEAGMEKRAEKGSFEMELNMEVRISDLKMIVEEVLEDTLMEENRVQNGVLLSGSYVNVKILRSEINYEIDEGNNFYWTGKFKCVGKDRQVIDTGVVELKGRVDDRLDEKVFIYDIIVRVD